MLNWSSRSNLLKVCANPSARQKLKEWYPAWCRPSERRLAISSGFRPGRRIRCGQELHSLFLNKIGAGCLAMKGNPNFAGRRYKLASKPRFRFTAFHQLTGTLSALTFLGVWGLLSPGKVSSLRDAQSYYANCDDARSAGAAPLHVGAPGYRAKLDRDGDGVACEPYSSY